MLVLKLLLLLVALPPPCCVTNNSSCYLPPSLSPKTTNTQVNAAIEDVLLEAAADEDEGLDFAAFQMLASVAGGDNSYTPLDQYDSRLAGSQDVGGSVYSAGEALQLLQPVPEQ